MIHRAVDTVQTRDKKKKKKKNTLWVSQKQSADGSCDKSRKAVVSLKGGRGGYDLVCADVPLSPPPPPSELMRGFLMLFLASWSWRAMRGCRREREEKAGGGRGAAGG